MKFITAIDRYILRLTLMPMFGIFLLAASLLMLDKMLKLFDFVATEGGPVGVVFKMLANLMPEYASLAIPLGLMIGILLAFRKLATSSELDVMRAVGLSYTRLLRMPYIITLVLVGVNLANVGYLQPLARYYYEELNYELKSGALGASIKVGEFTTLKDRIALRIEQSQDDGRKLLGIFVRVADAKGQVLSISARQGRFLAFRGSPDTIVLRLDNGRMVQDIPGHNSRVLTFTQHDLPIDLPAVEKFRQRGGADREYLLPELMHLGWNKDRPKAERIASQANFNYRMVEVVMMLLLPLLAVALAIPPKRSTSALGLFVSIVMIVAYHKINEYASDVASLGKISPVFGLWGPFALFAALIVWMYWRVAYVPGGQAIGWLERIAAIVGKRIRSLLRRRRKSGPLLPVPAADKT
ncbi:LPS export ABC transporter permease LptF [Novosphingobium sp. 9]|uniref:LPS export ABC transporter permease LptF n=1 Tax=Novosphingobium sp. 9 TaxID=2025349 RepID=UPI0021B5FAED|nr:LPS export ABC transporter permease LptF [Novosphingobium sp. 9]